MSRSFRQEINAPGVPAPRGHFSHAVVVNDLVYVSGLLALNDRGKIKDPGDARAQAATIFDSLEAILAAAETSPEMLIKLTTYVTRIEDRSVLNALRNERWPGIRAASTLVEVSNLAGDGAAVEIDAVAARRGQG
ncbi:RidA family protein [Saccharopolyspora spinosa]|uniref:2-iminobutanoate/2-iminopropanoate deaminase n=1 Tax=Saccharopolyspora spinosa TaxID=60894 RepID=Q6JHP7_SACSN|nr:RidA family protein [Saccharopolyspora spinosa]AAS00410.1 translation initiation inhibitor, YjgF family [Saccharopolyspora spinosa NRRL 18395]PKW16130.1 2-iminobutanoate/2-iminopropanoate deaminase [Saccharopolyspora spinosa]